jgi:hypothetical protein
MFAVIDSENAVSIEFQHYLYIRLTMAGGNDSEYSWRDGHAGFSFAIGKKANVDDDGWELDHVTTPVDYSSPSDYFLVITDKLTNEKNRYLFFRNTSLLDIVQFACIHYSGDRHNCDWSPDFELRKLMARFIEASITDNPSRLSVEIEHIERMYGSGSLTIDESSLANKYVGDCIEGSIEGQVATCWVSKMYGLIDSSIQLDNGNISLHIAGGKEDSGTYRWHIEAAELDEKWCVLPKTDFKIH